REMLKGDVAVVTGAGGGIGYEAARAIVGRALMTIGFPRLTPISTDSMVNYPYYGRQHSYRRL
ncbi:MAG: hypothetical protein ACP5JG_10525, partial [Anaerolineae bacterium]